MMRGELNGFSIEQSKRELRGVRLLLEIINRYDKYATYVPRRLVRLMIVAIIPKAMAIAVSMNTKYG